MTTIDRTSDNPLDDTRPYTWRGTIRTGNAYLTGGTLDSLTATNMTVTQEAWTVPTLLNSWVDYALGFDLRGYRKDASGTVHIQGLVKNGSAVNAVIFTLPTGYRPANNLVFGGYSYAGPTDLRVMSNGDVNINTGGSTNWSSITCSFAT